MSACNLCWLMNCTVLKVYHISSTANICWLYGYDKKGVLRFESISSAKSLFFFNCRKWSQSFCLQTASSIFSWIVSHLVRQGVLNLLLWRKAVVFFTFSPFFFGSIFMVWTWRAIFTISRELRININQHASFGLGLVGCFMIQKGISMKTYLYMFMKFTSRSLLTYSHAMAVIFISSDNDYFEWHFNAFSQFKDQTSPTSK